MKAGNNATNEMPRGGAVVQNKVQVEVLIKLSSSSYLPPSKRGATHWVAPEAAIKLLEIGVVRYVGGGDVAPPPVQAGPIKYSHGWPIDRFSTVAKEWAGETVVCIGGGPSVTQALVDKVRGRARVIAINDAYLLAPWADVLYFADADWWGWHTAGLAKPKLGLTAEQVAQRFAEFPGQKVSIFGTGLRIRDPQVHMLRISEKRGGLSVKNDELVPGGNGGYQSLNIAVLTGAKRILLLGYDMGYPGGQTHFHGDHPVRHDEESYAAYARKFKTITPELPGLGVQVFTCNSPHSRLEAFPRGDLESLLPDPTAALV